MRRLKPCLLLDTVRIEARVRPGRGGAFLKLPASAIVFLQTCSSRSNNGMFAYFLQIFVL